MTSQGRPAQPFTPGPWHRNIPPATKYPTIWSGRNLHVAYVAVPSRQEGRVSPEETEANINLIAAAPTLLDALEALLDEAEDVFVCMADATGIDRHFRPPQFAAARAAIRQALGEP